jgi:outer membrane protein assembly factor BamB/Spy/CpxP family protein refolding chaperone
MVARWTVAVGLGIACLATLAPASDWPQFRGPDGSATSAETGAPAQWSADKNIVWKAKVPGYGWSSPIIWGDKVFVTTALTDNQRKPTGGIGGGGFGGPGAEGGDGRFGAPPQPAQILPTFLQDRLNLTAEQKKQVDELQKEVDGKLAKILTDDQKKQLKELGQGGGAGRRGAGPGAAPEGQPPARREATPRGQAPGDRGAAPGGQRPGGRQRGAFGAPLQSGQVLSPFSQQMLNLTDDQKKQVAELQKEVDGKLAKILSEEQNKQLKEMRDAGPRGFRGGPAGAPPGAAPGAGGPRGGGGFARPQPGQVLPSFLQDRLNLTADQKKQVEALQKEVDGKLDKILTDEQKKQLKEMREGGGPGRGAPGAPGRPGAGNRGRGGFGAPVQPGQVLPPALQETLKSTPEQKKQIEELQKDVDGKLAKLLTEEQSTQLKGMQAMFGRGGPGGFGRARPAPDVTYKWEIYCLSAADGRVLWKQTAAEHKPTIPIHTSNTYATETPVTDGERVYAYFGMTGVFCYDLIGKQLWKADLGSYRVAMSYGTGSSPVADSGRVFVQCDNEEKSFLVALDGKTGKELWRTPRPERTSWSTPFIWKNKLRTELVCVGSPKVRSYDPATGKQLWELGGMNGQVKATPVASPDMLYVGVGGGMMMFGGAPGTEGAGAPEGDPPAGPGGGRFGGGRGGKPLFAVKAGASGDITLKEGAKSNDGVAWHLPQSGPSTASPLLYDGLLYVLEERNGLLSCLDAKTGKQVYKERLPGARGFTSSPWASGGKIFCLDDGGTTHVIQAGRQFKTLGKNTLGEMCWSSPGVAGGALFVRTVDHLYCIREQ